MPWLGCPHGSLPGRTAKTGPEKIILIHSILWSDIYITWPFKSIYLKYLNIFLKKALFKSVFQVHFSVVDYHYVHSFFFKAFCLIFKGMIFLWFRIFVYFVLKKSKDFLHFQTFFEVRFSGEETCWNTILSWKKATNPLKWKGFRRASREGGIPLSNSFVYYSINFLIGPSFCPELISIQTIARAVVKGKAVEAHTSGYHWISRSPAPVSPPGLQIYTEFSRKSLQCTTHR